MGLPDYPFAPLRNTRAKKRDYCVLRRHARRARKRRLAAFDLAQWLK